SPAFDAAVWELWPHLAAGASLHAPPADLVASPAELLRWMAGRGITRAFLPTPLAHAALQEIDAAPTPGPALRTLLTGGARPPRPHRPALRPRPRVRPRRRAGGRAALPQRRPRPAADRRRAGRPHRLPRPARPAGEGPRRAHRARRGRGRSRGAPRGARGGGR